jgi:hypothetical protein
MDNPPRPRQDGKIDKGSPATARSGGAERMEPAIGAPAAAPRPPEVRTPSRRSSTSPIASEATRRQSRSVRRPLCLHAHSPAVRMPLTTHRLPRQVAHNILFGAFPRTSRAPTARTDSAVTEQALSCALDDVQAMGPQGAQRCSAAVGGGSGRHGCASGGRTAPRKTNRSKKVVPLMDDSPVTSGIAVSSFSPVLMRQAISALPSSASVPAHWPA